jgi:hypothetical protein
MTVLSHTQKTRLHVSPVYFYLQYTGYWSQTMDGRLSLAQAFAVVNCKILSHYHYVPIDFARSS